jgi:hypothetical protein
MSVEVFTSAQPTDYLKFADGAKFHADLSKQSALSSAPVTAFGFLSQNPAGLAIQGSSLQVPSGETISLIGGDISISGDSTLSHFRSGNPSLYAQGGAINLASVGSSGEVPISLRSLEVSDFARMGNIELFEAFISAGRPRACLSCFDDSQTSRGGAVIIRGGRMTSVNSSIAAESFFEEIPNAEAGIDLRLSESLIFSAEDVSMRFGPGDFKTPLVGLISTQSMDGDGAGDIFIQARNLEFLGADVNTSADTSGLIVSVPGAKAGDITITAFDNLRAITTKISSNGLIDRSPGNIKIEGREVSFHNSTVEARSENFSVTPFRPGSISIRAKDTLKIVDNSVISTETKFGGSAGNIYLEGRQIILAGDLEGTSPPGDFSLGHL